MLCLQGLVKGLDSQMQRKYESIHLSLPSVCLYFLSFSSFSRVPPLSFLNCVPSLVLSLFCFHLSLEDRHIKWEVMSLLSVQSSCLPQFDSAFYYQRYVLLFSCLHLTSSVICFGYFVLHISVWHIQAPCSLSGSLRCMGGNVFTVYPLFVVKPMSQSWFPWKDSLLMQLGVSLVVTIHKLFYNVFVDGYKAKETTSLQWIFLCIQP